MRFFLLTVAIDCAVAAGFPAFHEMGLFAEISEKLAYNSADSVWFSPYVCLRRARKPAS